MPQKYGISPLFMDVLILARTRMSNGKCCVGGLAGDGSFVRLMDKDGYPQPEETQFRVRQIWEINYSQKRKIVPPHVEDVLVWGMKRKGSLSKRYKILDIVRRRGVQIWEGSPQKIFDELLQWTDLGSGYIAEGSSVPDHSVGFWLPDKDLSRIEAEGIRYVYPDITCWRRLKYVGYDEPVAEIPAGTLVRLSLSRWHQFEQDSEERCYLQLSGWYDLD